MREGVNLLSVILKLCNSAPLLVFLWTAFPNRDRLTLILFGLSTPLIATSWGGLSIFDWFLMNEFRFLKIEVGNSILFLPNYGYHFLNSVAQTMLFGAFVSHLKHFDFGFRDKLIQLDHHYSNGQALLIYWGCKILILGLGFGVFIDASRIAKGSYGFGATPNAMLLLQFLVFVKTLISLVSVYFLVQYFRKFMLEHLYSRGIVPSFSYWLMAIPILGLLVFASTLMRPLVPISERIQRFEQSAGLNNKDGIMATIVILQLFLMFLRNGFSSGTVITVFISIGFFVFFVHNEKALQIILGIIVLAIVYSFLGNNFEQSATLAMTSLYQLIMMYLLIGIFHIDSFEYLPALETEEPDLDLVIP